MGQKLICEERPPAAEQTGPGGVEVASRSWTVMARGPADAKALLAAEEGIVYGVVYQNGLGESPNKRLKCRAISAQAVVPARVGMTGLYRVTAEYSVRLSASGRRVAVVGGPPVWRLVPSGAWTRTGFDRYMNPIANRAEQVIEGGAEKLEFEYTLSGQWYVEGVEAEAIDTKLLAYRGRVNSATFFGREVGCLLCVELNAEEREEEGTWLVEAKLAYRPPWVIPAGKTVIRGGSWGAVSSPVPGWAHREAHYATRQKVVTGTGEAAKVSYPVIAGAGDGVPVDSAGVPETGGSATMVAWELYDAVDFNELI